MVQFIIGYLISEKGGITDSINHTLKESELIHISIYLINPNTAGRFEDSLFWRGGQFDPSPRPLPISRRTYLISI